MRVQDLGIRAKFGALSLAAAAVLIVFGAVAVVTLRQVQVNGPLYGKIVEQKDLVADILPPPHYIIESNFVAQLMVRSRDRATWDRLTERGAALEQEFQTRKAYWETNLADGPIKERLRAAAGPADEFFAIRTRDFLPAIAAGNLDRAVQVLDGPMTSAYDQHRAAIEEVVKLSVAESGTIETGTRKTIQVSLLVLVGVALVGLVGTTAVSRWMAVKVATPMGAAVASIERLARGDLTASLSVDSRDEVGRIAVALNQALVGIREALQAEQVEWAQIGAAREQAARAAAQEREQAARTAREAAELSAKVDALLGVVSAASAGDLTRPVPVRGQDAIGRVGEGLEQLLASLRQSFAGLDEMARGLSQASEQMHGTSQAMASAAEETNGQASVASAAADEVRGNIATVATAAEEMTAAIKEIARNASDVTRVASRAVEVATATDRTMEKLKASSEEIGDVIRAIAGIADQTNTLALTATVEAARAGEMGKGFAVVAHEVKDLAKESARVTEEIAAKIDLLQARAGQSTLEEVVQQLRELQASVRAITAIAQQTNLLAMNASIEAGRAGEMGRGFGVVAAEVKGLSQQTSQAADGITQRIRAIQVEAEGAVGAIREIGGIIRQINEAQTTIAGAVEEQSATTSEIGRNVTEAAKGSSEIASSLGEVTGAARTAASGAAETARAAGMLGKHVQELRQLLAAFSYQTDESAAALGSESLVAPASH